MKRKAIEAAMLLGMLTVGLSCTATDKSAAQGTGTGNPSAADQAWTAFNAKDYAGAIQSADECISESLGEVTGQQERLQAAKTPAPPTGAVSQRESKIIFARGALNNAATCLYIKGRSLEALGRKDDAKEAYREASKLTYARCWDPKGWFWSPSEGSSNRLQMLK